jgi:hypothetical protein
MHQMLSVLGGLNSDILVDSGIGGGFQRALISIMRIEDWGPCTNHAPSFCGALPVGVTAGQPLSASKADLVALNRPDSALILMS